MNTDPIPFPMAKQKEKTATGVLSTRADELLLERFRDCRKRGGFLNDGDALRDAVRLWVLAKEQEEKERRGPKVESINSGR